MPNGKIVEIVGANVAIVGPYSPMSISIFCKNLNKYCRLTTTMAVTTE